MAAAMRTDYETLEAIGRTDIPLNRKKKLELQQSKKNKTNIPLKWIKN